MLTALILSGLLQSPVSLIKDGSFATAIDPAWTFSQVQASREPGAGPGGAAVLRLRATPAADASPWSNSVHHANLAPIRAGDVVVFEARARSRNRSRLGVNYELSVAPNSKFITSTVLVPPEWTTLRFAGKAPQAFAVGQAQLALFLGYGPTDVELANVKIENRGAIDLASVGQTIDWYGGAKVDDSWRAAAQQRIEKIRKADVRVRVVDNRGRPVPGAKVEVEQVRHAFRFGTAGPAERLAGSTPDDQIYQTTVARLFNTFTFENDLKWNTLGAPDYVKVDAAMKWLDDRKFSVRGHNLVWGTFRYIPQGFTELAPEEMRKRVAERVQSTAKHWKGRLYAWDVVNEAATETELWERIGWDQFPWTYRLAQQADPKVKLAYNDYNITEEAQVGPGPRAKVVARIRQLQAAKVKLDLIGIQAHVGVPITPMPRVLEILDEMAKLGPGLEITEYDLGVQDDKIHAKHMGDFLTACFSHPAVEGFIMWGFWERNHWRANEGGAMFRADWSPRPAVRAYEDLVKKAWWTRESLRSDKQGGAKLRAYLGTHRVTVQIGSRRATVETSVRPGTNVVIVRMP